MNKLKLMIKIKMKNKKGFTLIEMLIVVAIIAILSGLILTGLGKARSQARDAKRMAQAKDLAAQLETEANLYNGDYTQVTGLCNQIISKGGDNYNIECGKDNNNVPWYCISVTTENIDPNNCQSCTVGGSCTCGVHQFCVPSQ